MNCEKASLLIEELYDGELNGQIRNRVEEHVAVCSFCRVKFEEICKLDRLLDQSSALPPSILLDQKLLSAFKAKHRQPSEKREAWRHWIFGGSINIPKPIFAALSILIAVAFVTANIMWKRNANPANAADFPAATAPNVSTLPSPEVIERVKVVEVPVIKEQIVTRVVYIEKKNFGVERKQNQLSITARNAPARSVPHLPVESNNSTAKSSVAENRHITRVNLDGFQPSDEPKVRVIREEKANENNEK